MGRLGLDADRTIFGKIGLLYSGFGAVADGLIISDILSATQNAGRLSHQSGGVREVSGGNVGGIGTAVTVILLVGVAIQCQPVTKLKAVLPQTVLV